MLLIKINGAMKKPWLFPVFRALYYLSYIGIIVNHDKDPYFAQPVFMESKAGWFQWLNYLRLQPGKSDHFACPKNAWPDKKGFVSCSMLFHDLFTKFKSVVNGTKESIIKKPEKYRFDENNG